MLLPKIIALLIACHHYIRIFEVEESLAKKSQICCGRLKFKALLFSCIVHSYPQYIDVDVFEYLDPVVPLYFIEQKNGNANTSDIT